MTLPRDATHRPPVHEQLRGVLDEGDLSVTLHRWLPGDPIPYEQMRRILGLPDTRKLLERDRLDAIFTKAIRKERHFREQPPGTCPDCGAHIEDWWTHHQFHEALVKAFEGRDRNIQKIAEHLRRTQ